MGARTDEGMAMTRPVLPGRLRQWTWVAVDSAIWFTSIFAATWLRYDFDPDQVLMSGTLLVATVAIAANLLIGTVFGPYAIGHQAGSFEEATDIARTGGVVTLGLAIWALVNDPILIPRSVPLIAGTVAVVTMFAARFFLRTLRARQAASRPDVRRVIVFGAATQAATWSAGWSAAATPGSSRSPCSTTTGPAAA